MVQVVVVCGQDKGNGVYDTKDSRGLAGDRGENRRRREDEEERLWR